MKLFIDTANVDYIREANDLGIICGVTTNPSLIAKEGRNFIDVGGRLVKLHVIGGAVDFYVHLVVDDITYAHIEACAVDLILVFFHF